MSNPVKIIVLIGALVCINASTFAQTTRDENHQLVKRIFDLLNSTALESKNWDDKAIAARTQARIADLLWDSYPNDAIDHLKFAWLTSGKVEEPNRERSSVVNPSLRNAVRRDVLLVARKRAPELAAVWLEALIEEKKSADTTDRGTFDDRSARSAVLLQMANEVVANNPEMAAQLVVESLRDGVSFNFQYALLRIQQKDPALAATVFRAALARLKTAGLSDPNELLTLYSYLYTPGRVFAANTSDDRNQLQLAVGGPRVSAPAGRENPALAREFLEIASDLLLSAPLPEGNTGVPAARSLVSAIGMLIREVSEQLPQKAALLRARAQQLDAEARLSTTPAPRRADIPEPRPGESKESLAERRVDLLEEAAAKGRDTLTRDIGYANAAVAITAKRYQRGLDLAGKIDDKTLREGVQSWVIYRAVLHFIAAGSFDEAYRLNLKNDDVVQRASCLVVGAQKLVKDKNITRAGDWLREAGALVKKSEANESFARITLSIVSTYGRFDTQASLDWLLYGVKLMQKTSTAFLNDDKAPAVKRISGITPVSDFTSETNGFSLQSAIAVFPPDQLEQVLYILNEITNRETRGIAVVTLGSNFLRATSNSRKEAPDIY